MTKQLFTILGIFIVGSIYGQKFEANQGSIDNIIGINQYKLVFEYPADLEVHKFESEKDFVEYQVNKRENKKAGSGETFRELWFQNRENRYEPTFVREFNDFYLEDRHVTVSRNYKEADHTMVIKVLFINPGKDIVLWHQKAELEVTIEIYRTDDLETLLFSTKPLQVHGIADGDEYEKVTTAFGQLGRWSAKFFCRKT
ncbi:MAG: hypothetical protein ACR2MT_16835 [Aurantibacter sp.]